jgi:acyl phosphate:glycerol-3-phosphate acyltransferase
MCLAALTVLLDGGKGSLAVILAATLAQQWQGNVLLWSGLAGLGAVIGHIFPVWLGFKGGKGVATAFGVFLPLAWPVGVACMATWLAVAVVFRISSMAALFAMALAPAYAIFWSNETTAVFALVIALLVIAKHRANISRLRKGEEPRIGRST